MKKNEPPKAFSSQCDLFLSLTPFFFPNHSSPFPSKLANKALVNRNGIDYEQIHLIKNQ